MLCKVCEFDLIPSVDFGLQPISNQFTTEATHEVDQFRMVLGGCSKCDSVQLVEQPDRELMFHDNYAFVSSTSASMQSHFASTATHLVEVLGLNNDSLVVEIGCNDGIFLENLTGFCSVVGIEPSGNVATFASSKGIEILNDFFSVELACISRSKYGMADLIYSANVMCHISDLGSVFRGVDSWLSYQGVLVFEDPYLPDILIKCSYDQIYDEHVHFFSVRSVCSLAKKFGLRVFKCERLGTHGGSMRYYICKNDANHSLDSSVSRFMDFEDIIIGSDINTRLRQFSVDVQKSRDNLCALIDRIAGKGKRLAAFGATSKSATILAYCGLGLEQIDVCFDNTPTKIGKFLPLTGIPVVDSAEFLTSEYEYTFLFAWNHEKEIFNKFAGYGANGGQWITHVPTARFL